LARANTRTAEAGSLIAFARAVLEPVNQAPAAHHILLLEHLSAVAEGKIDRLMVLMPPGSAKSTYASHIFPAWWLATQGATNVIAAAHTAELANHFGRKVRNLLAEHGEDCQPARDSRAAHRFATTTGGDYFATGVAGPLTGRRADLALIDDPIKSFAIAESAAARQAIHDWYRSEFLTRLKPDGRVVLIMTRWHEDDLCGRLMAAGDHWTTLKLPAIAEADDRMGRRPGEALWPGYEGLDKLARRKAALGARAWAGLYQQNPTPPSGTLFPVERIGMVETTPRLTHTVRAWDLAATVASEGRDPDWTVGAKIGRDATGKVTVLDIVRLRAGPNDVAQTIIATAQRDGHATQISLPQDPGQAGKHQTNWLTQQLNGYRVHASPETGSKIIRATPLAAATEAGNLQLLRADWNTTLINEMRDFPHGNKDDQVDARSRAFNLTSPRQHHSINLRVLAR
jgi:predicted phage terminase large subunit-like protein